MRLRSALICGAVLLAGCGVTPDEHVVNPAAPRLDPKVYGPAHANPAVRIPIPRPHAKAASPAVAAALDAGTVGVVDLSGTVGVRPRTMETASDAELQDLRWTRWDASGAVASGRLRSLVCQPSCATGRGRFEPATVTLSSVRRCAGRSYFDAAQVSVRGEPPAVYVRAPC